MVVTLLKGSETHWFERICTAAECVDCCPTRREISSFTKGGTAVVFEPFKLRVQLILSVRSLHCDSKAKAQRRRSKNMYFVLFCSAEFLSWGEMWKAPLSFATVDVLLWSNSAFVHITDFQSLALKLWGCSAEFHCSRLGPHCHQPKCRSPNQMLTFAKQKPSWQYSQNTHGGFLTCKIKICLTKYLHDTQH